MANTTLVKPQIWEKDCGNIIMEQFALQNTMHRMSCYILRNFIRELKLLKGRIILNQLLVGKNLISLNRVVAGFPKGSHRDKYRRSGKAKPPLLEALLFDEIQRDK